MPGMNDQLFESRGRDSYICLCPLFRPGFCLFRIRPHASSSLPTKPLSPKGVLPEIAPLRHVLPAPGPLITPPLRGSRQDKGPAHGFCRWGERRLFDLMRRRQRRVPWETVISTTEPTSVLPGAASQRERNTLRGDPIHRIGRRLYFHRRSPTSGLVATALTRPPNRGNSIPGGAGLSASSRASHILSLTPISSLMNSRSRRHSSTCRWVSSTAPVRMARLRILPLTKRDRDQCGPWPGSPGRAQ